VTRELRQCKTLHSIYKLCDNLLIIKLNTVHEADGINYICVLLNIYFILSSLYLSRIVAITAAERSNTKNTKE